MKCLVAGLVLLFATRVPGIADDLGPRPPISTLAHGDVSAADAEVPVQAEVLPRLEITRGTRLRMHLEDDGQRVVTGRLRDADSRSVTVDVGGGRSQRFSRDRLRQVEYRVGGRDRRRGGRIGATITGLAGLVACLVAWDKAASDTPGQGGGFVCGVGGLVAAAPGFGIGFAIGAPDGHWRKAKVDDWTVSQNGPSPVNASP